MCCGHLIAQGMLKRQTQVAEGRREGVGRMEKYEARNWKELTERQLSKLTSVERSRYMAVSCRPAQDVKWYFTNSV